MAIIHMLVPIETDMIKHAGETADGHGFIELDRRIDLLVSDEPLSNIEWKMKTAER